MDERGFTEWAAGLTAMGFLDEGTVLLLVTPMDFRTSPPRAEG